MSTSNLKAVEGYPPTPFGGLKQNATRHSKKDAKKQLTRETRKEIERNICFSEWCKLINIFVKRVLVDCKCRLKAGSET